MHPMPSTPIHVACLCAAWCRLCDEYAPVLDAIAGEFAEAGHPVRVHWVDIEDQADLVGEVDVEDFPTLVITDGRVVRFAGPLTPQPDTLRRMLRATIADASAQSEWPAVDPAIGAFARRLVGADPD
jgi:thiol-disulfide isomerase/thioredoxin